MPKTNKSASGTSRKPKTSTRKTGAPEIGREQAEKYLAKVSEQNAFWCHDGAVLRDVRDLKDALANMSDQTFAYHSNEIKKDFSNWLRDIVGDERLAEDLEIASTREQAVIMVEQRCNLLVSKA